MFGAAFHGKVCFLHPCGHVFLLVVQFLHDVDVSRIDVFWSFNVRRVDSLLQPKGIAAIRVLAV